MDLGGTLARLRRENGKLQQEVADYLFEHTKKKLSAKAVSNWEVGLASPSIEQFLLLCDLYNVADIRTTFRGVEAQWRLNELGLRRVDEYVSLLVSDNRFTTQALAPVARDAQPRSAAVQGAARRHSQPRVIRLFDLPVSAGTGSFLDSDSYEEIAADEGVSAAADYAVRVQGDSMKPKFANGQIVYVRKVESLDVGGVGVFALNGHAYLKKLGAHSLVSLNERYKQIPIRASDSFAILGQVIE